MEAVGDAPFGYEIYHCVHHVAGSCHAEAYVSCPVENHIGGLDEILRSLLHCYSSEERNNLILVSVIDARNGFVLGTQGVDGVVDGKHLSRILMILIDNSIAGQVGNAHNTVGVVHTVLLNGINRRIDVTTATVVVGGMDVDAQWLSADLLSVDSRGISEPVVGMDDVEVDGARYDSGNDGVVVNLFVKISGISSGELHRSEIIDIHIVEVGVDMVAQLEVKFGIHDIADPAVDIVPIYIAPCYWDAVHGNNIGEGVVLIAEGLRKTQCYVNVALCV